jgi:hypothetical protein
MENINSSIRSLREFGRTRLSYTFSTLFFYISADDEPHRFLVKHGISNMTVVTLKRYLYALG